MLDLGGGCGPGGTLSANGPAALGNSGFEIALTGADPGASVVIVHVADAIAPTVCGPCLLTPAVYGSFVRPLSNGGFTEPVPLPCSPVWVGVAVVWQCGVLSPGSGPCATFPNAAISNRLQATLDW